MRDGCVYVSEGHTYQVIIVQKNADWLEKVVAPIIMNQFNLVGKIRCCNGISRLVYNSKYLAYWLLSNFGCRPSVAWNTPDCIEENESELSLTREYIRGFFDAEGCISFWKAKIKGKKYLQQRLSITQYGTTESCESLEKLERFLRSFDVYMKIIRIKTDNPRKYRLQTSDRKIISKFWTAIGSRHPDKVRKFGQYFHCLE